MKIVEKYTGTKMYMSPDGALATPEVVKAQFPACEHFVYIVETDEAGEVMFAFNNLSGMRMLYGIDSALSESEAIAAIQTVINAAPPEPEPTPEERIAAQTEFQSMMML